MVAYWHAWSVKAHSNVPIILIESPPCFKHASMLLLCSIQDPKTGLPEHRRAKLATVFETLDKEKVSLVSRKAKEG